MKLNYKKVIFTGFAFFLICAFWQAYDAAIPQILTNKFGMNQTLSGFIMSLDNILAVFLLPLFGTLSDKTKSKLGKRTPFIILGTILSIISFIFVPLIGNVYIFIAVLLVTLVSMAIFRSPAVALMPDVTVKPLRSKANAIINLMGTAGGIIVLAFGIIFKTSTKGKTDFFLYILCTCILMAVALVVFLLTVKEKKWAKQMEEDTKKYYVDNEAKERENVGGKLSKSQFSSLILILASVVLWFMGYNAVTSKYSVYASNVLNQSYNITMIIAQAAAVISYIPVGIIASKVGRKKTILGGILILFTAFLSASFIREGSSIIIMYALFALAGVGWATINVNSFPMVVELSKDGDIGKYTGFYYTASMAAQVVTPILSGAIMDLFTKIAPEGAVTITTETGTVMTNMYSLFPYATIFVGLSFITMLFVRHGDSKPSTPKEKLEMLAGGDD